MSKLARCLGLVGCAVLMLCGATGCDVGVATIKFPLGDGGASDLVAPETLELLGALEGGAMSFQSKGVPLCELPTTVGIQNLLAEQVGFVANLVSIQKIEIKEIRCSSTNGETFKNFDSFVVKYTGPDETGEFKTRDLARADKSDAEAGFNSKEVVLKDPNETKGDFFTEIENAEKYGGGKCPTARVETNAKYSEDSFPAWKTVVYADVYLAVLKSRPAAK